MTKELIPGQDAYYERQQDVMQMFVKDPNETRIAKALGIPRKDVVALIRDFKDSARGTDVRRERTEELITMVDAHYGLLIKKQWEVIDATDNDPDPKVLTVKNAAIKGVADLERQRVEVMQKAGLLDAADMGDEVARMEEQQNALMEFLNRELCSACNDKLKRLMASYRGGDSAALLRV